MNPTTAQQLAALRQALIAIGLIQDGITLQHPLGLSDQDVLNAWAAFQVQNPAGAQTIAQQAGIDTGPNWLLIIGVLGGAVALYLVWRNSQKQKVDGFEYPDPPISTQLKSMSRALEPLHSMGSAPRKKGCKTPSRLGGHKYEFEPESRLEGYRGKRRVR